MYIYSTDNQCLSEKNWIFCDKSELLLEYLKHFFLKKPFRVKLNFFTALISSDDVQVVDTRVCKTYNIKYNRVTVFYSASIKFF